MRKNALKNAKLIVTVNICKQEKKIVTTSVYDNRTNKYWNNVHIKERGIENFLDMNDLKETLNWNLNGDSSKYSFQWVQSENGEPTGRAYIFQ